jgi:hypothetical protein
MPLELAFSALVLETGSAYISRVAENQLKGQVLGLFGSAGQARGAVQVDHEFRARTGWCDAPLYIEGRVQLRVDGR